MDKGALVFLAHRFATIAEKVMRRIIVQQVHSVDHCHHRIEPRHVRKAVAKLIAEIEGGSDGQWFRNAGRLDQQIVKSPLASQLAHLIK